MCVNISFWLLALPSGCHGNSFSFLYKCASVTTGPGIPLMSVVGGGGQMGGGPQIGAKSWIFQTELGPIPVTRCDQCYVFSHQV